MKSLVILRKFIAALSLILLLTIFGLLARQYLNGDKLMTVQTDSMAPTFYPGDAILVKPIKLMNLRAGDVVSYHNLQKAEVIVSHRVVSVDYQSGKIVTKGDRLDLVDPPIHYSRIIGKVSSVAPYAGHGIDRLRKPLGLILFVYTPAAVVLASEAKRLARSFEA